MVTFFYFLVWIRVFLYRLQATRYNDPLPEANKMTTPYRGAYRLYSFVPALYISPLQCGLQTAHAVSQMHADLLEDEEWMTAPGPVEQRRLFDEWAIAHRTIIICTALNSQGVEQAYDRLEYFGEKLDLPVTIFREDEQSLNGAATAAAVVVPERFFDAQPFREYKSPGFLAALFLDRKAARLDGFRYTIPNGGGDTITYEAGTVEAEFVEFLKSYRLA
jgi:hypothetical protein